MESEFIPYTEALALKELGFDEPCFGYFTSPKELIIQQPKDKNGVYVYFAPTYSQAFRWFREKYDYDGYFFSNTSYRYRVVIKKIYTMENLVDIMTDTYEEAELECLKKLIKIVKEK